MQCSTKEKRKEEIENRAKCSLAFVYNDTQQPSLAIKVNADTVEAVATATAAAVAVSVSVSVGARCVIF